MEEIWKPIDFINSKYEVSNLGNVRSLNNKTNSFKLLTGVILKNGYHYFHLKGLEGKYLTLLAHRLVAKVFLENPYNLMEVNHINGIKTDNRVENLEWVSSSQNKLHAYKLGIKKSVIGTKHGSAKLDESKVNIIRSKFFTGNYTKSELSREFNVSETQISKIVNNLNWKHI